MAEPNFKPVADSTMNTRGAAGLDRSDYDSKSSQGGPQMYALGVATVMQVNYEKHEVTMRSENGATFLHTVPLTQAAAGGRHFLGAMPLPGDTALVGYGAAESGQTRQMFIVGWFPSVTAGHDWWVTQPFSAEERGHTPSDAVTFEGYANRVRHKLRHMLPGNVVASSGQGADLVLDEGVLLANRRGNEIRLRDQDQSFIVRSLQQFHVGAGFRTYHGLVQRDSGFLPTAMFSDGKDWSGKKQLDAEGAVIKDMDLAASSIQKGRLTPSPVFQRDVSGKRTATFPEGNPFAGNADPYVFLQSGLFIDTFGNRLRAPSEAVYGGKAMYRVSAEGTNAVTDREADALTEYRIEVAHTSDSTLPVTEQTDGFDADRLPGSPARLPSALNNSSANPFIEFVLGSVVGNDAFSTAGRGLYGIPLMASIFDDPNTSVASPSIGVGSSDMGEHAATLFKVTPFNDRSASPTFWSVSKDGRVKLSVAGNGDSGFSVEGSFGSGMRLAAGRSPTGESFRFDAGGKVRIRAEKGDNNGRGVEITSGGTILIRGAGVAGTSLPSGQMSEPGLTLQSDTDALIKASGAVIFSAQSVNFQDTAVLGLSAGTSLALKAGDTVSQVSKTSDKTTLGKGTETFSGPKDGLPTNGAVREISITATPATGFVSGTSDKYSNLYGDRYESLTAGSHTTSVVVGDATYIVGLGTWRASSGLNTLQADASGVSITAVTGTASLSAAAGATSVSGSTSVMVSSAGPVVIKGTTVTLVAPGKSTGGIVCGSDLDPVSGLPLGFLGMGSPTHLLLPG